MQKANWVNAGRIGTGGDTVHFSAEDVPNFRPFGQDPSPVLRTPFPPTPMPDSQDAPDDDRSFEETLNQLEDIVERLEEDPPALDEALDAYEEGVALANECLDRLNDAEQRMSELSVDGD